MSPFFRISNHRTRNCAAHGSVLVLLLFVFLFNGCIATPKLDGVLLTQAQEGNAAAQFEIGERYRDAYYASSLRSDFQLWEQAATWYEAAAAQGYAKAQTRLADFYFTFRNDYARSLFWAQSAAVQGIAEAQYSLGMHYGQGWGTPQDLVIAYKWMALAFEGDIPNPIGKLANLEWLVKRGKMSPEQIGQGQKLAAEHTANYGRSRPMKPSQ